MVGYVLYSVMIAQYSWEQFATQCSTLVTACSMFMYIITAVSSWVTEYYSYGHLLQLSGMLSPVTKCCFCSVLFQVTVLLV